MKKSLLAASIALGVGAMSLAGCAEAPTATTTPTASAPSRVISVTPSDFKACMVSDSGGFDDKSFNQTSHDGLDRAAAVLGVQTGEVESQNVQDFSTNVQSMVDADCDMIVTVGYLLSDATVAAAKKYPEIDFAIVDDNPASAAGLANFKPLVFNTAESSFLAGYLAAGQSKLGTVGTFGGMKIPTVTVFMDGFAQGVDYYNEVKSADVKLLGWDPEKQDGQFVPEPKPFENVAGGQTTAKNLMSQGADIIFPVAGPAGIGALQAVAGSNGSASGIWVDTDGCVSAITYCSSILTSVTKAMDTAVFEAIKASMEGTFSSDPYVGTLENGGTGIAPFHSFEDSVSPEMTAELAKIKQDIIDGTIEITSASQPK